MTTEAIQCGLDGYKIKRRTGVVKGFPTHAFAIDPDLLVEVVRNGERKKKTYHMDFWEPATDQPPSIPDYSPHCSLFR